MALIGIKAAEKVIMNSFSEKTLKKFKLNFDGPLGRYYQSVRGKDLHKNAEVSWEHSGSKDAESTKVKPQITGRRWLQFLDGAKKTTRSLFLWGLNGKLNIIKLVKKCGLNIEPFTDEYLYEVSHDPKYMNVFQAAMKDGRKIDAFSFPKKGEIFFNPKNDDVHKRFAIAHELSHYLLGHEGEVFCKVSGAPDSDHEYKEYNEEADKLSAILLMPHKYMKKNLKKTDRELADRFGVSEHAVAKRKEETDIELNVLRYGRRR